MLPLHKARLESMIAVCSVNAWLLNTVQLNIFLNEHNECKLKAHHCVQKLNSKNWIFFFKICIFLTILAAISLSERHSGEHVQQEIPQRDHRL